MNKRELQDALKAKGITFGASATNAELEALLTSASETNSDSVTNDSVTIDDNLLKIIREKGGLSFDSKELQEQLKKDKEEEYPDYGREIPEGEYTITGFSTVHEWKSRKTDRVSHIRTAFIKNSSDILYELPFSCFCQTEWKFVQYNGKNSDGKILYKEIERKSILPFYHSTADRNLAVTQQISAGTRIKVCHNRGHYDNPYNTGKIFDFVLTWAELAS